MKDGTKAFSYISLFGMCTLNGLILFCVLYYLVLDGLNCVKRLIKKIIFDILSPHFETILNLLSKNNIQKKLQYKKQPSSLNHPYILTMRQKEKLF